jgi:multidrug resistance efflux pump
MNRRARWMMIGAVAAGATGVALMLMPGPAPAPNIATKREPEARVVAQAQVVPIDGIIEVRPLTQGKVLRVLVQPGDIVAADQLLAEIESDMEAAAVEQRQADMRAAGERLNLAGEGVRPEERNAMVAAADAARQEAVMARDRWQRQRQLGAQGFVSAQNVTEAESALKAAEARAREAALRAAAGKAGGRPAEIRAARQAVDSANAALSQGEVVLERARIVSPISGVIMARNVNPGDIIGSNVTSPTLFRVVDPARLEIRFEIEELLAPRVEVGLPVEFVRPGSKTIVGRGKVSRLAPQVEKRSIGADDARIRADSMVRPAWSDFTPEPGAQTLPVNYRLEAWVRLKK